MTTNVSQKTQEYLSQINNIANSTNIPVHDVALEFLNVPENKQMLVNFLHINGIQDASIGMDTETLAKVAHRIFSEGSTMIIAGNNQAGLPLDINTAFEQLLDEFGNQANSYQINEANNTPNGTVLSSEVYGFDFGDGLAVLAGAVTAVAGAVTLQPEIIALAPAASGLVSGAVKGINSSGGGSGAVSVGISAKDWTPEINALNNQVKQILSTDGIKGIAPAAQLIWNFYNNVQHVSMSPNQCVATAISFLAQIETKTTLTGMSKWQDNSPLQQKVKEITSQINVSEIASKIGTNQNPAALKGTGAPAVTLGSNSIGPKGITVAGMSFSWITVIFFTVIAYAIYEMMTKKK